MTLKLNSFSSTFTVKDLLSLFLVGIYKKLYYLFRIIGKWKIPFREMKQANTSALGGTKPSVEVISLFWRNYGWKWSVVLNLGFKHTFNLLMKCGYVNLQTNKCYKSLCILWTKQTEKALAHFKQLQCFTLFSEMCVNLQRNRRRKHDFSAFPRKVKTFL